METELKLENVKQQPNQGIREFVTYLNNLYSQLEEEISDKEWMWHLSNKCVNKIHQEMCHQQYTYKNIMEMCDRFIEIEQHLQSMKKLIRSGSNINHTEGSKVCDEET